MLTARAPKPFNFRTGVSASNSASLCAFEDKSLCARNLARVAKLDALLRWTVRMNMLRQIASLLLLVASVFVVTPLRAESVSATMQVSAQVIARAVVSVESEPAAIDVTADDIARGYVDVSEPIQVRVRTNSRSCYMLQVTNVSETFSGAELTAGDMDVRVGNAESWIQRPYIAGGDVIPMRARLRLSSNATPGRVSMPIAFSASPL